MFQRRVEGEFGVWLDRMVSWGFSHIPMPSFCAPPSPLLRSDRIYTMWGGAHVVARSLPGEGRLLRLGNRLRTDRQWRVAEWELGGGWRVWSDAPIKCTCEWKKQKLHTSTSQELLGCLLISHRI